MTSNNWVAGGELGNNEKNAQDFKQIVLDILQDNENVTKALQRLKPPPRRASNRRKNVRAKKGEDKGVEVEDPDDKAEKDKQFNLLTEAAAELISLGYEDIYQDNKDKIAANLHTDVDQGASRGGVVWHDDGTVRDEAAKEHAMYQRSTDNAALNYQESAPVASVETDQPAAASHQTQIPTPLSGPISGEDQAALNAAAAAGTAEEAAFPGVANEVAANSQAHTRIGNDTASGTAVETVASDLKANEAVTLADRKRSVEETAPAVPPAASDIPTPLPCSSNEAAAAAEHITHAAEPVGEDHALPAIDTAKESDAQQPPAEADHAQETAQDSGNKASVPGNDAPMPDGNSETALNSSTTAQLPDGEASTAPLTAETALDQQSAWQGKAKGPGLGDSREFSGGPVNFERPKYRHSPYGLPPVRPSGRFAPELGRSSPRGRGSPTGRSFGRGFSEPPRSSIMRPQYSQQPPAHMSHGVFLPQQYGGYSPQPLPPNYQHQAPYYPPQQPYPAPPQQGYPQYSGQQPYPPLQQQYPPQPYAQPPQYDAQAPQYDAQWQQYQQYSAYPQPAAYPPPAAAPPE
ncbi:TPA: hypothetical protein ACH3X2_008386 [Trebouxia sp. C0005]